MPALRNIRFLLLPALLLGTAFVHPATGSAATQDRPPCIAEKTACVPATQNLRYAGKVAAPTGTAENVFGLSVEIAGDLLAVGAPWDSEKGYRAGAVYLFRTTGSGWQQVAKLTPRKSVAKAMFGSSLDLAQNRLIVGAPGEKDGKMISAGAVYVFDQVAGGSWSEQTRIVSTDILAGDFFGASVAALADGIVVGAHLEDGKGIDSGAVYVFGKESSGTWKQRQKLQPDTIKAGTLFGNALATDGKHLVVGAYGYDGTSPGGGAVYVYRPAADGTWSFTQMLQPDQRKAFAEFGWTLALDGQRLLVGAPYEDESERQAGAAYLFRLDPAQNKWVMDSKLRYRDPKWQERFGASVALAGDRAIIGAPYGVAYVFTPGTDGKGWQQTAKLVGSYPVADTLFSRTVASDGRLIVLGVPLQDASTARTGGVYVFQAMPPAGGTAGQSAH
jgi:hypothetical protein